jgi:hypothetical protein
MNTQPHQQPPQGNAAPAAEHRPQRTTTQTWDQCPHDTHTAVLPDAFHGTTTPAPEANAGLFQHAHAAGTSGGRP